jgi:PPOX class probable FMN-dependent enzyme
VEFRDRITTIDELRAVISPPGRVVVDKETSTLDEHCRDVIARSPFVLVASTDGHGKVDVSPKGDAKGFVQVLDDATLLVPDRPGNHRADTFVNVLAHPWVGLLFLVPGVRDTLRVRGRAEIVRDADLLEGLAANGRTPALALGVHVTSAFFHCAKCVIRSGLWDAPSRARPDDDRLLARAMVDHGELDLSVDEMQERIRDDYATRLY